jgi:Pilus formation protein N terminal region
MRRISAIGCSVVALALYAGSASLGHAAPASKNQGDRTTLAQTKIVPPPGMETPEPGETPVQGKFEVSPPLGEDSVVVQIGKARRLKLKSSFKAVYVTDNDVIDVIARTDQAVTLLPKKEGDTNIYFVGQNNDVVLSLDVTVAKFVAVTNTDAGPEISPYRLVEVHNKSKLDSITNFRCGPNGCFFVGETTVEEPAPLPIGHSEASRTDNEKIDYQNTAPPAGVSAPPAAH